MQMTFDLLQNHLHKGFDMSIIGAGNDGAIHHHSSLDNVGPGVDHIIFHTHVSTGATTSHHASRDHDPGSMTQTRHHFICLCHLFDKGEDHRILSDTIWRFMPSGTDNKVVALYRKRIKGNE